MNFNAVKACILVAILSAMSACATKNLEAPTLPDEKIARIMADISVADAATNGLAGPEKDSLMQIYFKQVFEMHGTTAEVYEKDLRLITKDLLRMENIVKRADELLTESEKKIIQ